jgi:hypothetical protein
MNDMSVLLYMKTQQGRGISHVSALLDKIQAKTFHSQLCKLLNTQSV